MFLMRFDADPGPAPHRRPVDHHDDLENSFNEMLMRERTAKHVDWVGTRLAVCIIPLGACWAEAPEPANAANFN